jgi:taurine dioxygenase
MHIEPASAHVGAIVTDLDMTRMSDEEWRRLYQAWLDHLILIVRDQDFTIPQFLAVAERFGTLMPHVVKRTRHPDYPALTQMGQNTRKADGTIDKSVFARGQGWHTDGPWDTRGVCKATQLYGLEIPSVGGDTWFANMYASFEALPDALKQRLEGVRAEYVYGGRARRGADLLDPADRDSPPVVWPVIRVHPETERRSLYINPTHFLRFVDMSEEDGDALLQDLLARLIQPDAEYHHRWRKHDYVIWDNRCSNHAAAGGYPIEERRVHWRATIME